MDIHINIVKHLINTQFPEWSHVDIKPVKNSGHDNRTFHLGEKLAIRLPSAKRYEPQVEKEAKWLPKLASKLSVPITAPIAKGKPTKEYPYHWSINQWIAGETLSDENVDTHQFAIDLAAFLTELQQIDATKGPLAGKHNFYRGGDLAVYHDETIEALNELKGKIDTDVCAHIWEEALAIKWEKKPVWVHGDIAQGNIIVQNRRLFGVIDFGCMGTGDPACDLVIAWTFFDVESRKIFMDQLNLDKDTWNRARGWALWKALITYEQPLSQKVIHELINENK